MKITQASIKETFHRMSNAGVNIEKPLLWGFFVFTPYNENLSDILSVVQSWGYDFVNAAEDDGHYRIHFEKVGIYTPETLFEACKKFATLENNYQKLVFDGYDVGNPDKDLPITDVK